MKHQKSPDLVVIFAALLVLALPLSGWAQFTCTTNNGTITITGYTGSFSDGQVTIPSTINGYPVTAIVTSIGAETFAYCGSLTNLDVNASNPSYASAGGVLFNKTLTTLIQYPAGLAGSYAIPSGVTNIGDNAFAISRLTSVTIPVSVASIGDAAFNDCRGLTSVTIPNSVTSIGDGTFAFCSGLTSVTIPNSVASVGSYAFQYCTSLNQAFFQGNAPSVNGGAGSADTTVFAADGTGKAYYLPGTTGWGATLGGWPTAQWYQPQPQILGSGNGLGAGSQGVQFTISWATNKSVVVEASTDLQDWMPVSTNSLVNGTSAFVDSTWTNYPRRFYRLSSQSSDDRFPGRTTHVSPTALQPGHNATKIEPTTKSVQVTPK